MKKLIACFLLITFVLFTFSSCATMFSGSTAEVRIASDPTGARITIDGVDMGTTPQVVSLSKKSSHIVQISKDGYNTQTVSVQKNLGIGWLVLDLFTSLIGTAVDAATGNWNTLDPDAIAVTLYPAS